MKQYYVYMSIYVTSCIFVVINIIIKNYYIVWTQVLNLHYKGFGN